MGKFWADGETGWVPYGENGWVNGWGNGMGNSHHLATNTFDTKF